jgi:hypothetical protein
MALEQLPLTLYQGFLYGPTSIAVALAGLPYRIKSLNFKRGMKKGVPYANETLPLGYVRGPYSASGSLELWMAEANRFNWNVYKGQLVESGMVPAGLVEVQFDISVVLKPDNGLGAYPTQLNGVTIDEIEQSSTSGGTEGLFKKYTITILNVVENGIPDVAGQDQVANVENA